MLAKVKSTRRGHLHDQRFRVRIAQLAIELAAKLAVQFWFAQVCAVGRAACCTAASWACFDIHVFFATMLQGSRKTGKAWKI